MVSAGVLRFGQFTLKSGRQSPYFFNLGDMFTDGEKLISVGKYYAEAIVAQNLQDSFTVLFGSAYKGIPLAVATAIALQQKGVIKGVAFNRKEAKTHGETGQLIGAGLADQKILIIDDVITNGGEKQNAIRLVHELGGEVQGILIGLDRAEAQLHNEHGVQHLKAEDSGQLVPVYNIAHLDQIVALLKESDCFSNDLVESMENYRQSVVGVPNAG